MRDVVICRTQRMAEFLQFNCKSIEQWEIQRIRLVVGCRMSPQQMWGPAMLDFIFNDKRPQVTQSPTLWCCLQLKQVDFLANDNIFCSRQLLQHTPSDPVCVLVSL